MAKELEDAFDEFNRLYFKGELPQVSVFWRALPKDILACTEWDIDSEKSSFGLLAWISVSPRLRFAEAVWQRTLLHEMVHLHLRNHPTHTDDEGDSHGFAFLHEIRQLVAKGAYDGIW